MISILTCILQPIHPAYTHILLKYEYIYIYIYIYISWIYLPACFIQNVALTLLCVCLIVYRIIYGLPWIMIFLVTSQWFANNFHERRSQEWKSLVNHLTIDQNVVNHGNPYIIHFFFVVKTQIKTPIDRLPHPCCLRWISRLWHCDDTQTPIVASFWLIVLRTF